MDLRRLLLRFRLCPFGTAADVGGAARIFVPGRCPPHPPLEGDPNAKPMGKR